MLLCDSVRRISSSIRSLLRRHVPQIVATAESFVDPAKVLYLPVSATGGAPQRDEQGNLRHRVKDLNPIWAEVPLLYVLSQFVPGLIPFAQSTDRQEGAT
jgi:hypothetical protein